MDTQGAIHRSTGKFVCAKNASKLEEYVCVECSKKVIPKQGPIRAYHFAHMSESKCNFYNPGESEKHKNCKYFIAEAYKDKKIGCLFRTCLEGKKCVNDNNIDLDDLEYKDGDNVQIEYSFKFNDKDYRADVAVVNDEKIRYIFEIKHTSLTCEEDRPEPWFEFTTKEILEKCIVDEEGQYILTCCRKFVCNCCEMLKNPKLVKLPKYKKNYPCYMCDFPWNKKDFLITYGKRRQVCKMCYCANPVHIGEIDYETSINQRKIVKQPTLSEQATKTGIFIPLSGFSHLLKTKKSERSPEEQEYITAYKKYKKNCVPDTSLDDKWHQEVEEKLEKIRMKKLGNV